MSLRNLFPELIVEKIVSYIAPKIAIQHKSKKVIYDLCIYCNQHPPTKQRRNLYIICEKCKYYSCPTCIELAPIICTYCGTDTTQKIYTKIYQSNKQ